MDEMNVHAWHEEEAEETTRESSPCQKFVKSGLLKAETREYMSRGGIELCSRRAVEGCRKKIMLNFSRTCVLFLFVMMFL
jgi:hypothetical protein